MMSNKEKKRRQHEKELKSLRNKMCSNLVWFDSLSKLRQYDLLFLWKKEIHKNKLTSPEWQIKAKSVPVDTLRPWGRKKIVRQLELVYPPSLKHFIKNCKKTRHFLPLKSRVRESAIDLILNNK